MADRVMKPDPNLRPTNLSSRAAVVDNSENVALIETLQSLNVDETMMFYEHMKPYVRNQIQAIHSNIHSQWRLTGSLTQASKDAIQTFILGNYEERMGLPEFLRTEQEKQAETENQPEGEKQNEQKAPVSLPRRGGRPLNIEMEPGKDDSSQAA